MKLPWFTHKDFEIRMNCQYNEEDGQLEFYAQKRMKSKIPFRKWTAWENTSYLPDTSFEKVLDSMNNLKNRIINAKQLKRKAIIENQKKKEWEKIDI